jgi:4-amino-4-deoxy-L-arabinose transferase-like glycosyltransferase
MVRAMNDEHPLGETVIGSLSARHGCLVWGLIAFALVQGVISIVGRGLIGHDDARVAGIARGMDLRGDYAVPYLNGERFLEYPSLGYIPIALVLSLSDHADDFLALLPAVLLGLGTIYFTYRIGLLLGGARIGLLSGFMLATTAGFYNLHRRCLVDPSLLLWITVSLYGFIAALKARNRTFPHFALFYLGMAAAFLSKGLLGIAVPAAVSVAYLIVTRDRAAVSRLRPFMGALVFSLPLLLWGYAAYHSGGYDVLKEVVRQSVWRFSSSEAPHSKSAFFYLDAVLYLNAPWILLGLVLAWLRWGPRRLKERLLPGAEALFPAVWFVVTVVGLSVASAKRNIYLAPLFPAFAVLSALTWDRLSRKFQQVHRIELWLVPGFLILYAAIHFAILLPTESPDAVRPSFEDIAHEVQQGEVVLYQPNEGLRGAAVFYLGKTVPVASDFQELKQMLTHRGRVLVVVMAKKGRSPFEPEPVPPGLELLSTRNWGRHAINVYLHSS